MKKNLVAALFLSLLLTVSVSLADDGLGVLPSAAPALSAAPEAAAVEALLKEVPGAVVHYALLDTDNRRAEWDIFFTDGTLLGECEVDAETFEIRKLKSYEAPADALTADKAIEALKAAKGDVEITEFDLDRDDGSLWYEGDCLLDGRRYEFEMNVSGRIVEWERD